MTLMSREGDETYQGIMTNWARAFRNPVTREAVEKGWSKWSITHRAYHALKMRDRHMETAEVVTEGERGESAPYILILGDEGYGVGWGLGVDVMLRHFPWSGAGRVTHQRKEERAEGAAVDD